MIKQLIEKEQTLLESLETPTLSDTDRRSIELELDVTREKIEKEEGNPMEMVYDFLDRHPSRTSWRRAYHAKGFTNPQFLVSSLMDENSPLKSCLLYHGVGVGKTCAAIAGSSSYKGTKQIIVLTPSQTLVKNWRDEFIGKNHCGRYIWNIPVNQWKRMSERKKVELLNSHIQITGYLTFANQIEKLANSYKEVDEDITDAVALIRAVRTLCDGRFIIMDEIHNTRQQGTSKKDDDVKKIRPVLETISRYARQTKLLLLSATPMYNEVNEIDWIMNLMRWNQGLSSMSNKEWLNHRTGDWKAPISKSKEYLTNKIRGFVSYIRGENPYTFPRRLDPLESRFSLIREKGIVMVKSEMTEAQQEYLNNLKETGNDAFGTQLIQNTLSVTAKIDHRDEESPWTPEVARKWSPKLWTAWEALKDSVGPIFMYSQYLSHGINEMASILEEMGWIRMDGPAYTPNAGKVDPYCWANKCHRSKIQEKPVEERKPFQQARYALVDGSSTNLYSILKKMNDPNNIDGSQCAVLLGSRVIEVGVSLKCIRQVHILEPWYHLNSMEQAIGRAIRNRSHLLLPESRRNLTVFLHCATTSVGGEDSVDLQMYKMSIEKMQMMSQVTKIMAHNAIDCDIQKHINYIRDSQIEIIEDCYGNELRVNKGDQDFSARCGYSTCEIECTSREDIQGGKESEIQKTLYDFIESDKVFPTNIKIIMERIPAYIQGVSAVNAETVGKSLGVSKELADRALGIFVENNIGFPNINGTINYLKKLETDQQESVYVVSLYPNLLVPQEQLGIVNVQEGIMDAVKVETLDIPQMEIPKVVQRGEMMGQRRSEEEEGAAAVSGTSKKKVTKTTKKKAVAASVEMDAKPVDIARILEVLNRSLMMVEGLTPMRKSIEKKGSLEVANLNTDAALKRQAAYQRYIGYAEERKAGEKKIARRELYPSIILTYVEHLLWYMKDSFYKYLIESTPETMDKDSDIYMTVCYIREVLSGSLNVVPILMDYRTHIRPYIPEDIRGDLDKSIKSSVSLNAYAFTKKTNQCIIRLWQADGSWITLPNAVVLEWKLAMRAKILPIINAGKEKYIWIEGWINPNTYEFTMKVPRKDPHGENPKSKKAQVLGGLCGQALFVKQVEEIVEVIDKLTEIKYKAASKRIKAGSKSLPSGIYWPRPQKSDEELLTSLYLGGVNKRPSKTSTGSSLCEEMEYILRIIAYSEKDHPMRKWVQFRSSLEQYIVQS